MSFLSRLLGDRPAAGAETRRRDATPGPAGAGAPAGQPGDEQALERYRYLLRTAPPEALEQAHAEAFGQLTPAQRRRVLEDLNRDLPAQERAKRDAPRTLARVATRAELRRPGTLERTFGGADPRDAGVGAGGLLAGNFLSTVAGVVVGTAVADALFGGLSGGGLFDASSNAEGYLDGAVAGADQGADAADAGASDDFSDDDLGGEV